MILADTSVWIGHFREDEPGLRELLSQERILIHPFVIGEIACGHLPRRAEVLKDLRRIPFAVTASDDEVFSLLDEHRLWGRGIGWIDVHLLASALLTGCRLWTHDEPLRKAATDLKVQYSRLV